MHYFASLLVRYENAVALHSLEFAAQNAMRYCLSATLVIIEHPDPCSTAESDTNNDLPVVCATKPVKPQSFYSQPKRRFNNGTPALVPGEQEQSMEVQPTTSNSKSTTCTGRRRKNDARNPDDPDKQATPTVHEERPLATKWPATSRSRSTHTDVDFK